MLVGEARSTELAALLLLLLLLLLALMQRVSQPRAFSILFPSYSLSLFKKLIKQLY